MSAKLGRPRGCTPKLIKSIALSIANGRTNQLAAIENGIGVSTFCLWQAIGRGEKPEQCYLDFLDAVEGARLVAKQKCIDAIMEARDGIKTTKIKTVKKTEQVIIDGKPVTRTTDVTTREVGNVKSWQAGAWLLERQYPAEFGRVNRPDDLGDSDDVGPKQIKRGMLGPGDEPAIDIEATDLPDTA